MAIWRFSIEEDTVRHGNHERSRITAQGCNEPFKDRYWCPKMHWFKISPCPFVNRQECENYETMCGCL
ncbi:MAG: hypothetical protein KKE17_06365 [Proteobacteria bacterium]|nr:hypothetical protein [Pseudomonadota bacterium]MBU1709612.1 hypothetical protein [Pseudomonadota bacterium]